jgi:hypothetical protein
LAKPAEYEYDWRRIPVRQRGKEQVRNSDRLVDQRRSNLPLAETNSLPKQRQGNGEPYHMHRRSHVPSGFHHVFLCNLLIKSAIDDARSISPLRPLKHLVRFELSSQGVRGHQGPQLNLPPKFQWH